MTIKYRAVCTHGCYTIMPLESKKDAEFRAYQHFSLYRHETTIIKEIQPKKSSVTYKNGGTI